MTGGTSETQAGPSPIAAGRPSRRLIVRLSVCLLVLGVAGLGWYAWHRATVPQPPAISLEGVDPDLARVVTAARQKVLEEPASAARWGHLGKVLLAYHYDEPAAACFVQAERLDPADARWPYYRADALLQHDPDAALPLLGRAVELCDRTDPGNTAPRLRLAETLLAVGRSEEAEKQLALVLRTDPDSPRAHLNLGMLAYDRDDLAKSREHLERCQDNPSARQRACNRLAEVCLRLGDRKKADAYTRAAAASPPDRPWEDTLLREFKRLSQVGGSRFLTVEALEAAGRHQEAVATLREMVRERPDFRSYVGLGKNLLALGDYEGAEQALRAAVEMGPEKAQAYYYLSKLFFLQAERQRAKAPAAGGDPSREKELFQSAADYARKAIDRKPDHALAHLSLGLSLKNLGRRADGIAALRKAVECRPDGADLYLYLGEALAEDGQRAEARVQLKRAAELARPDDPRPREALDKLAAAESKSQ
jgi:tetratricopeptide (TPR) repeat protein